MFQSTHPRGVRHTDDANLRIYLDVSIHAPTRGATYEYHRYLGKCKVSIHAPTRGATLLIYFSGCNFKVSIHAPTRGATFWTVANTSRSGFQSTHPRGVRQIALDVLMWLMKFQSTHPRGVRRQSNKRAEQLREFQSTHPRGVRLVLVCGRCKDTLVSIHAPTRGATDKANDLCPHQSVSIHAPTRGATTSTSCRRILQTVSIHAPTRGATDKGLLYRGWHLGFNPRTHEGCDIYCSVQFISVLVSIHAPTRGATDKTERHFNVKMFQSTHPRGVRQGFRTGND